LNSIETLRITCRLDDGNCHVAGGRRWDLSNYPARDGKEKKALCWSSMASPDGPGGSGRALTYADSCSRGFLGFVNQDRVIMKILVDDRGLDRMTRLVPAFLRPARTKYFKRTRGADLRDFHGAFSRIATRETERFVRALRSIWTGNRKTRWVRGAGARASNRGRDVGSSGAAAVTARNGTDDILENGEALESHDQDLVPNTEISTGSRRRLRELRHTTITHFKFGDECGAEPGVSTSSQRRPRV